MAEEYTESCSRGLVEIDNRLNRIENNIDMNRSKIETINMGLDASRDSLHVTNSYMKDIESKVTDVDTKVKSIESNGFLKLTENVKKGDLLKILIPIITLLLGSNIITINLSNENSKSLNRELIKSIQELTN